MLPFKFQFDQFSIILLKTRKGKSRLQTGWPRPLATDRVQMPAARCGAIKGSKTSAVALSVSIRSAAVLARITRGANQSREFRKIDEN